MTAKNMPSTDNRDIEMLRMWLLGANMTEVGAKFGLSKSAVSVIAKRDNWGKYRAELKQRNYNEVIDSFRDFVSDIVVMLKDDVAKLVSETVAAPGTKKKKRKLTPAERQHARQLLEFLIKENRLEDGKPTEHAQSTVEHTLRLPPGVKHSFIIPPDKSVKVLPAQEEKEVITLDKLLDAEDDDGQDKK